MILILFGKLGAGKTFVGRILERDFGFLLYDADKDIPIKMKYALLKNQTLTNDMRDAFFPIVIDHIKELSEKARKIVVTQTFLKEKYRKQVLEKFPDAKFILIKSHSYIRAQRLIDRQGYRFTDKYVKQMDDNFDAPAVKHSVIINNSEGKEKIIEQLRVLLITRSHF